MIQSFRENLRGISSFFRLLRAGRLKDLEDVLEKGRAVGLFQIDRFDQHGKLLDHGRPFPNILVNVGLAEIWNLVTGQGGTAFSNANANLGVGDSNAAPAVGQTDLQAAVNKLRKAMEATYPIAPVNGVEVWRSSFTGGEANFSWQEFAVFNAAVAGVMMNRSISNQGTKTAGQVWQLTYTITLS